MWRIGKFIRKRKLSDLGFDNFFCFGIIMVEDRRSVVMKIRKSIFILLALVGFLFLPSRVLALDLKLTYNEKLQKCFDDLAVLPSYDDSGNIDGFLFLNRKSILKKNLDNVDVYDITINNINVSVDTISSDDQEYDVKGKTDLLITGYDDNENIIFEKQYGGNGFEDNFIHFDSVDNNEKRDGYIVIIESTSTDLAVGPGYIMLKLDLNGELVFEKNISDYISNTSIRFFKENNTTFAFAISNDRYSIAKLKLNGSDDDYVVWEKDTDIYVNSINYSYDVNGEIDGVIVVGKASNTKGAIIKYDLNGNEIFRDIYNPDKYYSVYYDAISSYLPDGTYDGYIVTGVTHDERTILLKYDLIGNIVNEIVYSANTTYAGRIFNNYDSNGNENGYMLLWGITDDMVPSRVQEQSQRGAACNYLTLSKYTYDMFPVAKEETSGGTITVKSDAYPGELVKVKVLVKEGYSLARIIVKDESGKEIEVNSDGTFVMPEGKVTVSAIYKRVTNPETVSAAYMVLGVVLLIAVGSLIVIKNKNMDI